MAINAYNLLQNRFYNLYIIHMANISSEEMKMRIAKQNVLLSEQSGQLLSLVDVINAYDKETDKLKAQLEICNTVKNQNSIDKLKLFYNTQFSLFMLLVLLIISFCR
jgi:chromosome condensin MukBEF complex kleisin-like MukF subunit